MENLHINGLKNLLMIINAVDNRAETLAEIYCVKIFGRIIK